MNGNTIVRQLNMDEKEKSKYDVEKVEHFKNLYQSYFDETPGDKDAKRKAAFLKIINNHHEFAIMKQKAEEWDTAHREPGKRGKAKRDYAPQIVITWDRCITSTGTICQKYLNKEKSKAKNEKTPYKPDVTAKARFRDNALTNKFFPKDPVTMRLLGVTESVPRSYRNELKSEGFDFTENEWGFVVTKVPEQKKDERTISITEEQLSIIVANAIRAALGSAPEMSNHVRL